MARGHAPMVPAIAEKWWHICDGCGEESAPDTDIFGIDVLPPEWAVINMKKKAPLHFCSECISTIYINGVALDAKAAEVLGEDYFK